MLRTAYVMVWGSVHACKNQECDCSVGITQDAALLRTHCVACALHGVVRVRDGPVTSCKN